MTTPLRMLRKPLLFGLFGAAGCLLGALIGEVALALLLPSASQQQVEVLFVLNVTSSMQPVIDGVKNGIKSFVSRLGQRDARVGLIAFGDLCFGEEQKVLTFGGEIFTRDTEAFNREVGQLALVAGGDLPESSLDALALGARQPFDPAATKVAVLITDAPPHDPNGATACLMSSVETPSVEAVVSAFKQAHIDQLHLVLNHHFEHSFSELQQAAPGTVFSLAEAAAGRQDFDKLLPQIGERIAMAISTETVEASRVAAVLAATAVWTASLAIGTFLLLITGQNHYLRRPLLPLSFATLGAAAGVIMAGLTAGALGQLLSSGVGAGAALGASGRLIAWALLGALLCRGMAFFIPNLPAKRAMLGGALGGALGALGFIWVTGFGFEEAVGDVLGRLTGAAILGLLIGMMISLVEMVFREAWLEVSYGPKEVRTVSLGGEPVSIGGDAVNCTVYARGAASKAYVYRLEQGRVTCEDLAVGQRREVPPGHRQQVGNVSVTVCVPSGAGATSVAPAVASAPSPQRGDLLAAGRARFSLRLSANRVYPLTIGKRLSATEIPGLESQSSDGAVAEVNQNPTDASILGLKNLSYGTWEVRLPDGSVRQVEAGRSIKLTVGTRVNFGSVEGEVIQ